MYDTFGASSHWVSIDGPVHFVDFAPMDFELVGDGPPIVCVHGLGGSFVNWLAVGRRLTQYGPVFAVDLGGFGLTPSGERGSTVTANRELLAAFLAEVIGEPVILIGNSMGGAISIMEAAAEPEAVVGLVLVGPAVPRALLAPMDRTVAKTFATHALPVLAGVSLRRREERLGAEGITYETLDLCCVDTDRVQQELIEAAIAMRRERMKMPWAEQAFLDASRSLMLALLKRRTFDAQVAAIRAPTLIVQGAEDRLVAEANTRRLARLRPDWRYEVLDDVGHVPQLEVPDVFLEVVGRWLRESISTPTTAE